MLLRWELQSDAFYPQCSNPEDCTHVLRCQASSANDIWQPNLTKLIEALTQLLTPTGLLNASVSLAFQLCTHLDSSLPLPSRIKFLSGHSWAWKTFLEGP